MSRGRHSSVLPAVEVQDDCSGWPRAESEGKRSGRTATTTSSHRSVTRCRRRKKCPVRSIDRSEIHTAGPLAVDHVLRTPTTALDTGVHDNSKKHRDNRLGSATRHTVLLGSFTSRFGFVWIKSPGFKLKQTHIYFYFYELLLHLFYFK